MSENGRRPSIRSVVMSIISEKLLSYGSVARSLLEDFTGAFIEGEF